jgi:hypothetical protein
MRTSIVVALLAATVLPLSAWGADDLESRLGRLEAEIARQAAVIAAQQQVIDSLKASRPADPAGPDRPQAAVPSAGSALAGGGSLANPSISVILDAKGYASNRRDQELAVRGIPGFTTEGYGLRNGANVDAAELVVFAPVDPYFNLHTTIPVTSDGAELEEAYAVTTSLPAGLQIKGGRFKSATSRLNAQHPHAWDFADLPLPYRAFLGPEGLGGENGIQLTWQPGTPVYSLLGLEVLQGDNPLLFGGNNSRGPHAYTAFGRISFDTSDDGTFYLSPWVMTGATRSAGILDGFELNGDSTLSGLEAVWKWRSGPRRLTLQGEYLFLSQSGTLTDLAGLVPDESLKRRQDGAVLQGLYGFGRWGVGARYDRLELLADRFRRGGVDQTFARSPWRLTGSLEYAFTEFSRVRAQFSHDRSDRSSRVNNEGLIQFTFTIGAHGAHTF